MFLSAVEHVYQRDCNARKSTGKQSSGKGKQSKSWSKNEGKGKTKENEGKSKGQSKGTKGAKGSHKCKTSKTGLSCLENSKSETSSETQESAQTCPTGNSWVHDGWSLDERNDGWSFGEWNDSVGWHEGWEQTWDTSASSFSLGGLDLGATSSPKRFEWVKMNLDTGAVVNTFPLHFGPDGAGDGCFCRTASGEWIPDGGAWQCQGYVENGLLRSLNGRLTGAHKVCKEQQGFYVRHDGGYMIPIHSKIGQGVRTHFEKLVNWHGKNELIPVYLENSIFNFYLSREVKSIETNSMNYDQQSGNEYGKAVRS